MPKVSGVVPTLPTGVRVGDKPSDIEFCQRSATKWVPIIESLKVIDNTKCIEIDVTGLDDKGSKRIKYGIKRTAKLIGYKSKIKFAIKGNTMYIWCNR